MPKKKVKRRSFKTIQKRLDSLLNPSDPDSVLPTEKVSKYVHGGPSEIVAFINVINKHPGFAADGSALSPSTGNNDPVVHDLLVALVRAYWDNGWLVT